MSLVLIRDFFSGLCGSWGPKDTWRLLIKYWGQNMDMIGSVESPRSFAQP